jgi:hypothetical protein
VRHWAYCHPRCGSASVPEPCPADTGCHDFLLDLLRRSRRFVRGILDALTRTRAPSRPRDADPR